MKISRCPIGTQLSRLAERSNSGLVADAADEHWHAIHDALSAVVGAHGVGALYLRSVYLTRAEHPWLVEPDQAELPSKPLGSLHAALSGQSSADAAAAQASLLQTFNDLLENLIGSSLTDRLLGPLWQQPPGVRNAQDHPR